MWEVNTVSQTTRIRTSIVIKQSLCKQLSILFYSSYSIAGFLCVCVLCSVCRRLLCVKPFSMHLCQHRRLYLLSVLHTIICRWYDEAARNAANDDLHLMPLTFRLMSPTKRIFHVEHVFFVVLYFKAQCDDFKCHSMFESMNHGKYAKNAAGYYSYICS